jgi:glycosyltransferase involved in cell wall biosynthesis
MNLAVVRSKLISGVTTRVVLSEHNDPWSASNFRKSKKRFSAPAFLKRTSYRRADAVVGISEGVADGIAKTAGMRRDEIRVIYNPIFSERIQVLAKESVPWPMGRDENPVRLIAIGRLSPQKDLPTLLEAFNIFRKKMPAQLVILGEGKERKELEAEIQEQGLVGWVHLLGYVNNPYAYLSAAHVFFSSSLWEGLPTVHVEALACGCQVVSTDCPSGPSEILAGGKYGRLVPVKDPQALADAIEQAFKDPLPKDVLRKRAEYFSFDRAVDEYWRVLMGEL